MALKCQAPSCDHEFSDLITDPHEAIMTGHRERLWSLDRAHIEGLPGTETLNFCSDECVVEFVEEEYNEEDGE